MAVEESKVIWKIKAIELLSFKAEEKAKSATEYDPDKINFNLGVNINVDPGSKLITIMFPVQIFSDETHSELLGSIHTKGEFIIKNFDELFEEHGKKLPMNIIASLVGVLLSSTRGMLILLSKGTVFEKAIIPIINPVVFFSQEARQSHSLQD